MSFLKDQLRRVRERRLRAAGKKARKEGHQADLVKRREEARTEAKRQELVRQREAVRKEAAKPKKKLKRKQLPASIRKASHR